MLIEIPDEAIAKVALGLNNQRWQFSYERNAGNYPLLVEVQSRETAGTGGIYFRATRGPVLEGEITLSLVEIFENIPRVTRLLKELESGVPS